MRIAILIGVSEYINCNNLPGCLNDIKAIGSMLSTSKEFDEIKEFKGNVNGFELKKDLSELFTELKGKSINELFFYFTGHGSFYNSEFYYVLSDFDENKRRQTSLQNSEIDNMIKSVNPEMVTKIIDACQSGVSYIKGNDNLVEKYYSKTSEGFKKCYFMHSSMTNQYSYQDDKLSDFTKGFIGAVYKTPKPIVRYKDIIDYISDEFEKSTDQTPFFVTQADHTEGFIKSSEEIRKTLEVYFKKEETKVDLKSEEIVKYDSYVDKIIKDSESYSTKEEAENLLLNLKQKIEKIKLKAELVQLFNLKITFEHYLGDLPRKFEIGKWLEENSHSFFAKADYERTSYEEEVHPSPFGSIAQMLQGSKTVTKYRNELVGFETTIDIPYKSITIDFVPIYPNIPQYAVIISFLISKRDIKIFNAFTEYKELGWDNKLIRNNFKWQSEDFLIKNTDKILEFITSMVELNSERIIEGLKKKFEIEK